MLGHCTISPPPPTYNVEKYCLSVLLAKISNIDMGGERGVHDPQEVSQLLLAGIAA